VGKTSESRFQVRPKTQSLTFFWRGNAVCLGDSTYFLDRFPGAISNA